MCKWRVFAKPVTYVFSINIVNAKKSIIFIQNPVISAEEINSENSIIPDSNSRARPVTHGRDSAGPSVLAVSVYAYYHVL